MCPAAHAVRAKAMFYVLVTVPKRFMNQKGRYRVRPLFKDRYFRKWWSSCSWETTSHVFAGP